MKRTLAGAAVTAAILTAALTACSSGSSAPGVTAPAPTFAAPAASTSAGPANPVALVKMAGATTTAKLGKTDIEGDRYAGGDLPATGAGCFSSYTDDSKCLEFVQVYTYADAQAQADSETRNPPTDTMQVVKGNLFDVSVYPVGTEDGRNLYPVSAAVIAQRVHGTVLLGQ